MQPGQPLATELPKSVPPQPGMDIITSPRPSASEPVDVGAMATAQSTGLGSAFKPVVGSGVKNRLNDHPFVALSLDFCFRVGFGLVFIINAVTAIIQPAGFKKLIESNFLATAIGHTQIMLYVIAINDALLGVLIVAGVKRQWVYAWAGLWLFIVTFIKFTSL